MTQEPDNDHSAAGAKRSLRLLLATLGLLVVAFVGLVRYAYVAPSPGRAMTLDQVYEAAQSNTLRSVKFLDEDAVIVGERCLAPPQAPASPAASRARPSRCYDVTEEFHVSYPASQVTTQQLIDVIRTSSGAEIVVDKESSVGVAKLVVTFVLPLLMLANLFALIFLSRTGQSSMADVLKFGRFAKKGERRQEGPGITFADVAGADEAVVELREVIDYLTDPARFEAYGAAPPKGVLLFGPPGCGKTLLARATAGESGVAFFSTSGTEFVESLVGVGAARVRDLFRQVREVAPAIMFIDEIDAVGRRRSGEGTSGGEREQTLNQLLVELDGFDVSSGVVLMGATNRPDILDPALLRPGRFDRHITMEPPDVVGRKSILELHAGRRPIGDDVDFGLLAARTPGFTGADLANVINEAALLAIRDAPGTPISASHLAEAVLRVLHGPQRRGKILSPEERRRLAYHEAGHAVVAAAVGGGRPSRISIVARGRGVAQSLVDKDERVLHTAGEMQARLAMAMAGVAAEVVVFGESSTTALDDISKATAQAREIVGLYGMSASIGPVRLLNQVDGYMGSEGGSLDLASGPTLATFDAEVRALIVGAQDSAAGIVTSNRSLMDEMAESLQTQETLEGDGLAHFLASVAPTAGVGGNGSSTVAPAGTRGGVRASRASRAGE